MQDIIIFILFLTALAYILNSLRQSFSPKSKGCASNSCKACEVKFETKASPQTNRKQ